MRWTKVEEIYGPELKKTSIFNATEEGKVHFEDLHKRVIEHVRTSDFQS